MGRRGPQPKPLVEKKRTGGRISTARGQTRKIPDPVVVGGLESAQPTRRLDDHGAVAWKRLVPMLARAGLADSAHADLLTELCETISELHMVMEQSRSAPLFYETASGYMAPHPLVAARRELRRQLQRLAAEFGLSPASQVQLVAAGVIRQGAIEDPDDAPARPAPLRRVK